MQSNKTVWLLLLVALVFGTACGQADPPTEQEQSGSNTAVSTVETTLELLDSRGEATQAEPQIDRLQTEANSEEAVTSDAGEADPSFVPDEVDANGIPVGFTIDGLPYRGNLDASVVIEEFSDYQ